MNCFNHRDRPAIGLCKSCLKGLCEDCLTEVHNGLACKGSCEDRVNIINRMLDSKSQIVSAARHQTRSFGALSVLMGIACFIFAAWARTEFGGFLPYFIGLLGVFTLLIGILRLSRKEQYPQPEERQS